MNARNCIGARRLPSSSAPAFINRSRHTTDRYKPLLAQIAEALGKPSGISRESFLHSEAAWDAICMDYESRSSEPSFLDYFWTVRTMHGPLFALVEAADALPPARIIHSVCTGYAGFLGALLHYRRRLPFVLTEHGIYTKERRIDLAHAPWIHEDRSLFSGTVDDVGYLRQLLIASTRGSGAARIPLHTRSLRCMKATASGRSRMVPTSSGRASFPTASTWHGSSRCDRGDPTRSLWWWGPSGASFPSRT